MFDVIPTVATKNIDRIYTKRNEKGIRTHYRNKASLRQGVRRKWRRKMLQGIENNKWQ